MGSAAGLQLGQQVSHVRLDRLLGEEETNADVSVHEALRDELEDFDLASGRLLLELLERAREGDDLCTAARPARRHLVEAAGVVDVAVEDFSALGCVHDPGIGRAITPL